MRSSFYAILFFALGSIMISPPPAKGDWGESSHHWQTCLHQHASQINIHPALLEAIVEVESKGHPWAFGWKTSKGTWKSWQAPDEPSARRFLRTLWKQGVLFDMGIGQINSRNLERFWGSHQITPIQALKPCTNLWLAATILKEQIDAHGYTWRAINGYNGGSTYARKVWRVLCERKHIDHCPSIIPSRQSTSR